MCVHVGVERCGWEEWWDLEVGGGQVSVVDGTAVLRASISFVLIANSQTPPLQRRLQLRTPGC